MDREVAKMGFMAIKVGKCKEDFDCHGFPVELLCV
jgi:hypothetical protein